MSETVYSTTFDDDTGTGDGLEEFPTGWSKGSAASVVGSPALTVYTGQTTTSNQAIAAYFSGWATGKAATPSSGTGPGGGMDNDLDATTGTWDNGSAHRYLYIETSGVGSSTSGRKYHLIRTAALDLSSYAAGDTITLKFWFHMYGAGFNDGFQFGVAATTATDNASDANEAGTGLGFTGDTTGGGTINYWTAHDGSTTASGVRITNQQQTSGHTASQTNANLWRLAEVDLSAAAGQSDSVYIYFLGATGASASNRFRQDLAIDNVQVLATRAPVPILLIEDDHDIHTYDVVQARYDIKEIPTSLTSPAPRHLQGRPTAYNLTQGRKK